MDNLADDIALTQFLVTYHDSVKEMNASWWHFIYLPKNEIGGFKDGGYKEDFIDESRDLLKHIQQFILMLTTGTHLLQAKIQQTKIIISKFYYS